MLNVDFRSLPTTPSMQVDSASGGPPCAMGRPAQPTNAHAEGRTTSRPHMPVYVVCVRLSPEHRCPRCFEPYDANSTG